MHCYKINVESLSISNRKESKNDTISLYEGDLFFIDSMYYYAFNTTNDYSKLVLLKKIFYKKVTNFSGDYTWTWINDINILDPIIDYGRSINHAKYRLAFSTQTLIDKDIIVDYTKEWNRENNIQTILSEIK